MVRTALDVNRAPMARLAVACLIGGLVAPALLAAFGRYESAIVVGVFAQTFALWFGVASRMYRAGRFAALGGAILLVAGFTALYLYVQHVLESNPPPEPAPAESEAERSRAEPRAAQSSEQ